MDRYTYAAFNLETDFTDIVLSNTRVDRDGLLKKPGSYIPQCLRRK